MANVEPAPAQGRAELEPLVREMKEQLGFVPNSILIMAHRPEIVKAFVPLVAAVMGPGTVPAELKQLVALVANTAAGCRYCQAHTSAIAGRRGVDEEKIEHVWEFETAPCLSEAERAALRLARDASLVPNCTTPEHFASLRSYFSSSQIVELVAVVALFGWLNRWNDTLATPLEPEPLAFAAAHLASQGWNPGKHGA